MQTTYTIFVREVTLDLEIGIYEHEKGRTQKVGVEVEVEMSGAYGRDTFLNYDHIVDFLTKELPKTRFPLQEDLAEAIKTFLMAFDQAHRARIQVTKPEAYPDALAGVSLVVTRD